jgi:outer membrane lipoprotein
VVTLAALWLAGCSVVSKQTRQEALPQMPFLELVNQARNYIGETVILGGYVVQVTNHADRSEIIAVQAPLGTGQEPKSKDRSQGRLILDYAGFIDPQVYTQDRKLTVAGKLLGSSQTETGDKPFPYLHLQVSEIHLWAVEKPRYYDPYWDYWMWHPYYYPYPFWWRHPYYWD